MREAAGALGISESLTRELINSGELVAYRYGQRKTVVYPEDLAAFKESRRVEALNSKGG